MLSQHSARRDHNGIPTVRKYRKSILNRSNPQERIENENWNRRNKELLDITTKILDLLAQIGFLERWFLPHLRSSKDPGSLVSADQGNNRPPDRSVREELVALADMLNSMQQRWQEIFNIMSGVMVYTLRGVDDRFPPFNPAELFLKPITLIRVWTQQSHSPYSEDLGFRCSGWTSCGRYTSIEDLEEGKILTTESLQNHCEKKPRPSLWISFSDDASWLLYYAQKWRLLQDPTCRVAVISVERLERCNIPWGRSNDLVKRTGASTHSFEHPDGVHYAWARQILVYGHVPAHCLLANFTVQRFCELCRERNIRGMHLTH